MRSSRVAALGAIGLAVLAACGGGGGILGGSDDSCRFGIGLGSPPCDCVSWAWHLDWNSSRADPDLSVSPARVDISVGQRFGASMSIHNEHPNACNRGYTNGREDVRSTDPSVVAFAGNDPFTFTFVGVAPGSATLVAENLPTPTDQLTTANLTACTNPPPRLSCGNRVPLVIRVVP